MMFILLLLGLCSSCLLRGGLIVSSIFVEVAKFHNPVRDFDLRGPPAGYWDLVWD